MINKKSQAKVGQTIYVTNYFLTHGIIEAVIIDKSSPWDMVTWKGGGFTKDSDSSDWFFNHDAAVARGLELANLQIEKLNTEIQRLEQIKRELTVETEDATF